MKRLVLFVMLVSSAAGVAAVAPASQVQTRLFGVGANVAPAEAFFADTTLQEVRLTVSTRDWQSLKEINDNTYYPADFRWRNEVLRNVGIRSRGTGSRSGTKPGLRVDFDRYAADQTFLGLKSFVLRNNTQDASNMHERLTMQLYKRLGIAAPRESFAKLYINDQYVGLYTIVESVDKAFLRRSYGEDEGYLYEYDFPDDPEAGPYYFTYRGPDPDAYVPSPFKPETHEHSPMAEVIERWVWTVDLESDAVFRSAIGEYLDLARFVRYVAVEQFVGDTDGFLGNFGISNFYVYRPEGSNPFTFIPWDKSEAFKGGVNVSVFHNIGPNRLMLRALEYPDVFDAYLNALQECGRSITEPAAGVSGGWLEREIQREYTQIRDAARTDPVKPFSNDDFEQAVQDLLEFARGRNAVVAAQIAQYREVAAQARRRRGPFGRLRD